MPAWWAACITVLPSATSSFLPSISISNINSVSPATHDAPLACDSGRGVGGEGSQRFHLSNVVSNQALLMVDVILELVAKMVDERAHRHCRRVTQRADGASLDVVGNVVQEIEVFRLAAARLDAVDHAIQPAGAFAARRALAARFLLIK